MRICYVSSDHGIPVFGQKGASIHVQSLVNTFASMGHEVTVLATRIGERREGLDADVVKVRDESEPEPGEADPPADAQRLAKERRYLGLGRAMEHSITEHHRTRPFDFLYERYSLWSAAGVRAAAGLRVPCIVEVNAPLVLEQQQFRELALEDEAKRIEHEVFSRADALVAVSNEVRRYAIDRGAAPNRVEVIPNGVDPDLFSPSAIPVATNVPCGRFVIGFVGSLKGWHDVETLLEAFRILAHDNDCYHLLVVGDGPLRPWIDGYITGARLQGRATVTGWVEYKAIPGLLARVDVAVAPYPQMEVFYFSPLKLYEYLAAGRAIVASAIGQVAEVVREGITGLLVPPGDARALAAKIDRLRADDQLRETLGRNAALASREHSWRRNAERVLDLLGSSRKRN